MPRSLMKCGHLGMATKMKTGEPVCPICFGTTPDAEVVDTQPPPLTGRMAKCGYCGTSRPSDYSLPFFALGHWERVNGAPPKRTLDAPDEFYCGCRGWD